MSMIVAHNLPGINTNRQFGVSARGMSTAMERLSSGFKINTGKDDPAGLLISEKLRSQLNGIDRARQNTEEAMNVMGIAEGALTEMNDILKKMKSLATHSANNGVTTSDQIQADQSELDSAVQTMDRIAQTTEFAGEKLLNGAKEISFDSSTAVKGTQQNSLVNNRETSFDQIYKRDGYAVSISYTGVAGTVDNLTGLGEKVNFANQASKAYMELDTGTSVTGAGLNNPKAQVKEGVFTQDQTFTLTGSLGSRQFNFSQGQPVTALVSGIHSAAGSTGVDASLIFNSDQTIDTGFQPTVDGVANGTVARSTGQAAIFGSDRYTTADAGHDAGTVKNGVTNVDALAGVQWGLNTDGQGNIYIKYVSDTQVELYKDSSMSPESLVATGKRDDGDGETKFTAYNNSGLSGTMTIARDPGSSLADLRGNYINTGGIAGNNGVSWSGNIAAMDTTTNPATVDTTTIFNAEHSVITGIELGKNTDSDGKLYFKVVVDDNDNVQVFAYKDKNRGADSLVAMSENVASANAYTITLDAVKSSDGTASTGLGIVFALNGDPADLERGTETGELTFDNLGARIYASEYGSDHFLKVTQDEGSIFTSFENPGDGERTLLDAGANGTTKLIYGQDATIGVNGKSVKTNGLNLNMATQDIQARLTFNAGKVGSTTLAQVGYDVGSPFTKAGALNLGESAMIIDPDDTNWGLSGLLCNAGHNTNEKIENFENGMQLQLGEGSGDQNRTVLSLKSMTTENLGRIVRGGYWDTSSPTVWTEKTFTLKDIQGGGAADLRTDPALTMAIIDKAIDDVAGQRAMIGAMQSNLLQTNANNLEVTLENVTKTESGIRDADMATEMAEFTKNQVLQSAAMSMMSQANQQSQNALQLLR